MSPSETAFPVDPIARLIFPHIDHARLTLFRVHPEQIETLQRSVLLGKGEGPKIDRKVTGIEIEARTPAQGLTERIEHALDGVPADDVYLFAPTSAQFVEGIAALRRRSIGPLSTFGIDPAYYRTVVPLDGPNSGNMQRYVLDLKKGSEGGGAKDILKRAMIGMGKSSRLYESFVVFYSRPFRTEQINALIRPIEDPR